MIVAAVVLVGTARTSDEPGCVESTALHTQPLGAVPGLMTPDDAVPPVPTFNVNAKLDPDTTDGEVPNPDDMLGADIDPIKPLPRFSQK